MASDSPRVPSLGPDLARGSALGSGVEGVPGVGDAAAVLLLADRDEGGFVLSDEAGGGGESGDALRRDTLEGDPAVARAGDFAARRDGGISGSSVAGAGRLSN